MIQSKTENPINYLFDLFGRKFLFEFHKIELDDFSGKELLPIALCQTDFLHFAKVA